MSSGNFPHSIRSHRQLAALRPPRLFRRGIGRAICIRLAQPGAKVVSGASPMPASR